MRILNRDLLDRYRLYQCSVNACTSEQICAHHIKTKGSGGDDEDYNLLAVCFKHHTELHQSGLVKFSQTYPEITYKLKEKGWTMQGGRWVNCH
jgi:hypothetical protein